MKFDLKKLHRRFSLFLISSAVIACTFVQAFAVDDVRVTNWPTQYSVVNTTWDQRLATLQTTLQTQSANISTLVNRFGWNGTYTFSQGFELLYNDVHSMATATSQSDILTAFNREFSSGPALPSSDSTKGFLRSIALRLNSSQAQSNNSILYPISVNLDSIDTYTQHIDSDLHGIDSKLSTTNTRLNAIQGNTNTMINSWTTPIQNISSKTSLIAVDTSNISVDTEHISATQDVIVSEGAILVDKVSILQDFFADPQTVALKESAEPTSNYAIAEFTSHGKQNAATQNDFSDISGASADMKQAFDTGQVDTHDALDVINGRGSSGADAWAWFTQATYESINPAPTRGGSLDPDTYMAFYEEQLRQENRKSSSDTPLLDNYNDIISKAIWGDSK